MSVYDQNAKKIEGHGSPITSSDVKQSKATPEFITDKYGEGRVLTSNGITVDKQANYSLVTINW